MNSLKSFTIPKSTKIYELNNAFPADKKIPLGKEFRLLTNNVSYSTHTIHKYPSKFIPQVPHWAIQKYLKDVPNSYVFDLMCGSGTTMLEAFLQNKNSVGVDVDPLACLISKVKITPISSRKLDKAILSIKNKIARRKRGRFLPRIQNLEHWFEPEVIHKLTILRDIIDEQKDEKDLYDFLLVVFSSIIRRVSNADNESQKTYVSHTVIKHPAEPYTLFLTRLKKYSEAIDKLSKLKNDTKHFIYNQDSRNLDSKITKLERNSFDLAITSPPYIKALDYIYTNMAEYFWIGDIIRNF